MIVDAAAVTTTGSSASLRVCKRCVYNGDGEMLFSVFNNSQYRNLCAIYDEWEQWMGHCITLIRSLYKLKNIGISLASSTAFIHAYNACICRYRYICLANAILASEFCCIEISYSGVYTRFDGVTDGRGGGQNVSILKTNDDDVNDIDDVDHRIEIGRANSEND